MHPILGLRLNQEFVSKFKMRFAGLLQWLYIESGRGFAFEILGARVVTSLAERCLLLFFEVTRRSTTIPSIVMMFHAPPQLSFSSSPLTLLASSSYFPSLAMDEMLRYSGEELHHQSYSVESVSPQTPKPLNPIHA